MAVGLTQDEEKAPAARQNPLLRKYFRQEYPGRRSNPNFDIFVEHYIDRRIDYFLEQSQKSLQALQDSLDLLVRLQDQEPNAGLSPSKSKTPEVGKAYAEVADQAGRLRKQLATVFPRNLRTESDFKPASQAGGGTASLPDLSEISNRLGLVERHLDNYLFGNYPVVSAQDLKQRDVLVLLHEIQVICRHAERSLKPE